MNESSIAPGLQPQTPNLPPVPTPTGRKAPLRLWVGVILLICILAASGYYLWRGHGKQPKVVSKAGNSAKPAMPKLDFPPPPNPHPLLAESKITFDQPTASKIVALNSVPRDVSSLVLTGLKEPVVARSLTYGQQGSGFLIGYTATGNIADLKQRILNQAASYWAPYFSKDGDGYGFTDILSQQEMPAGAAAATGSFVTNLSTIGKIEFFNTSSSPGSVKVVVQTEHKN